MDRLSVAVDATSMLGVRTGIGRVTASLVGALAGRDDVEVRAFAVTWRGRDALAAELPAGVLAATRRFPARLTRVLWPRDSWPRAEGWTGPVDVVHATNYVAPPARAPTLLTVADLTYLRYPELCTGDVLRYPRLVPAAIARGATLHAYSEFVAGELRDTYGLPAERVVAIPPGVGVAATGDASRGRRLAGADRYVLAVGTVEPRKNLPVLVRAFDAVAAHDPAVHLVVAGADGWGADAFDAALDAARHRGRVRRVGSPDDTDRDDLLAGAAALAYPSIYEGFGLPPLEAMRAGVPVVAARAGSLPEVLGDAALLPDPTDVDAVAAALTEVLDDEATRARLVERGRARVARYRWDESADRFVDVYRRLAGHRPSISSAA